MRDLSCAECVELGPDVALGIADAQDRAAVLAHVERCRSCRDELETLSSSADLLCVLVPPVEPPAGFAFRVVDEISGPARAELGPIGTSSRRSLVRPLSVAAAVVVAAGLGVGGWLAAGGASGPSTTVETASLVSGHDRPVGEVMVMPGKTPWISVAVSLRGDGPEVRCKMEGADGEWRTVGMFELYRGWGYWAAPLPGGGVLRAAELLSPSGRILAKASFPFA